MGKKMKFPWPPTCVNDPKTLSFRATDDDDDNENIYKTTFHCDKNTNTQSAQIPDSFFSEIPENDDESAVILDGLKSERLFFEPGKTNSILEQAKSIDFSPYNNKIRPVEIVEMESKNPLVDFRATMEVMVETYGWKNDWENLEKLLNWYLSVNGENYRGCIIEAFVDLVIDDILADFKNSAIDCSSIFDSPLSKVEDEIVEEISSVGSSSSSCSL